MANAWHAVSAAMCEHSDETPAWRVAPGSRCEFETLEQILLNLTVNARDAMPAGDVRSMVAWRVVPEDGAAAARVQLEVRGLRHGPGHTDPHLGAVLTTKPSGKSSGLGLSIVRAVTGALGGQLSVRSEPGRGRAFELSFPEWVHVAAR